MELRNGEVSANGQVEVIDQDRLCYQVRYVSKESQSIRTISKALVAEFVEYVRKHPNASSADARAELCGQSEIDSFEYGYRSTLFIIAKMVIDRQQYCLSNNQESWRTSTRPLQQIYYGAPGTGKSHTIKEQTNDDNAVRTTFHPDTDYSCFVGAYKPTTKVVKLRDLSGHWVFENGKPVEEEKIVYEFVPQAFLQAYEKAWRKYIEAGDGGQPEAQFLVIEEINRGNCAQIFGDLFQLLDCNRVGFSDYPIVADMDMQRQLVKMFERLGKIPNVEAINAMYKGVDVAGKVERGEVMLLPNNLYIWATMNTSDQSLFPIDSAFKRRWDWKYMPISNAGMGWQVEANGQRYDWWEFLWRINEKIASTTSSEDKQLGYFFAKADDRGVISSETFVGKVIFYLWNDVFKDYEYQGALFDDAEKDADGNPTRLTFRKFFTADGKNINEEKVELFLKNLGVGPISPENEDSFENVGNKVSFKVNDLAVKYINEVPYTSVKEYVRLHPQASEEEILSIWKPFSKYTMRRWFVLNEEEHQSMLADETNRKYAEYSYSIALSNGRSIYVNKDGWMYNDKIRNTLQEFITAVESADLGIHIEVISVD